MNIELKVLLPKWIEKAAALPAHDRQAVLREGGAKILTLIRDRVARGEDINNSSFAPYSTTPIYVSKRQRNAVAPRGGRDVSLRGPQPASRSFCVGLREKGCSHSVGRVGLIRVRRGTPSSFTLPGKSNMNSVYYAGGYAQYRASSGLGSSPVNLSNKGRMLRAMKVKWAVGCHNPANANAVAIGWPGGKEALKALGHQTGANRLPVRKFFGLSDDDKQKLIESITPTIMRLVHQNTDKAG